MFVIFRPRTNKSYGCHDNDAFLTALRLDFTINSASNVSDSRQMGFLQQPYGHSHYNQLQYPWSLYIRFTVSLQKPYPKQEPSLDSYIDRNRGHNALFSL
jgi:hypothetical protein